MAEDKSKISIALSKRVKFLIGGLLVGFVLGVSGVLLVQSSIFDKQSDEESAANAVSVVFSRIVEQNELVSVSQDYSIVKKPLMLRVSSIGLTLIRLGTASGTAMPAR